MKKLLIALACAASFAAMADVTPSSSGFENETAGTKIDTAGNDSAWSQADGDPASEVKTYAGESMATYDGFWGSPLATAYGLNYLALDTGGGELIRHLAFEGGVPSTVPVTAAAPVYIDTLVQFTATDPSTEVSEVTARPPDNGMPCGRPVDWKRNFFTPPLRNFIASAIIAPSADEPGPRKGRDAFAFLERN